MKPKMIKEMKYKMMINCKSTNINIGYEITMTKERTAFSDFDGGNEIIKLDRIFKNIKTKNIKEKYSYYPEWTALAFYIFKENKRVDYIVFENEIEKTVYPRNHFTEKEINSDPPIRKKIETGPLSEYKLYRHM